MVPTSFIGTKGRDTLTGTAGNDWFQAGEGDDVLQGRGGNDVFEAGAGRDRVVAGKGTDTVFGGAGNDTIVGGGGADSLDGGEGDDHITGGTGADTILGGLGNDRIFGKGGADSIDGGAGNDTIHGGRNGDRIDGGAGNDLIHGYGETGGTTGATDTLMGGEGDDTIFGSSQADLIEGGQGNDLLDGNGGRNTLDGGDGRDTLHGDKDAELLLGGEGDDIVYADAGNDTVRAGEGADKIYGGAGADSIDAGGGADLVEAGEGNDRVSGGAGNDEMQGEEGNDTITGGDDDGSLDWDDGDTVPGGGGDTVPGGGGDTVPGGGGDTVPGGGGDTVPGGTCKTADELSFVIDGGGSNPDVLVTVKEVGGRLQFTVNVTKVGTTGDLRGLFFDIKDETLLGSLRIDGPLVTQVQIAANAVDNLKDGVNLEGTGVGGTDIGIEIGASGIGKGDDIQTATFTLSRTTTGAALDVTLLENMTFVARLTSVGTVGAEERPDSLKLVGNAGKVAKVCEDATAASAPAPSAAPATPAVPVAETSTTTSGPGLLAGVTIGDNLYGNDGRDHFVFGRGDGVDMIWDFEAGRDQVIVNGYALADVDLFTTTSAVTSAIGGGAHDRLVMVLDKAEGDAIVFNDLGNAASNAVAVTFAGGGTLTVRELVALATPDTTPVEKTVANGDEVAARIKVVNAWNGGFQAELTVTATRDLTDWDVQLGTKWALQSIWNAQLGATAKVAGGFVADVNDADWNGVLLQGQSATVGFTATTGANLGTQQILDGIWIG